MSRAPLTDDLDRRLGLEADELVFTRPEDIWTEDLDRIVLLLREAEKRIIELLAELRVQR